LSADEALTPGWRAAASNLVDPNDGKMSGLYSSGGAWTAGLAAAGSGGKGDGGGGGGGDGIGDGDGGGGLGCGLSWGLS